MTDTETKLADALRKRVELWKGCKIERGDASAQATLRECIRQLECDLAAHASACAQPASELPCEVTLPGQWKGDGTVTATRINGDMFIPTNEDGGVYVSRDVAAKFFGFTAQPASVAPDVQIEVHPKGKRYQVWLIRAHQSFEVGPSRDEFAEAKWYADMLAKALWPERDAAPQPAKEGV